MDQTNHHLTKKYELKYQQISKTYEPKGSSLLIVWSRFIPKMYLEFSRYIWVSNDERAMVQLEQFS